MDAMKTTTVIVNNTNGVVKLKMSGHQHFSELATIVQQGRHDLHVNVNETYREFVVQAVGSNSTDKSVIVTSDDCCDNECITVKEVDSGKFEVQRVARKQNSGPAPEVLSSHAAAVSEEQAVKGSPTSTWFGWLRHLLWAHK